MIELHFYSGKAYSATKKYEDDKLSVSFGQDGDGNKIAIADLRQLGIQVVGDEELFTMLAGGCDTYSADIYVQGILKYIFKHLTPEMFASLILNLAEDRYSTGHNEGTENIQYQLRTLLGLEK